MTRHTRHASQKHTITAPHAGATCDVFVYGTLRHGEINDIALAAARYGRTDIATPVRIATGSVPGRLVDFGNWPGLLPEAAPPSDPDSPASADGAALGTPMVIGDVFRIDVALLPILDEIEGIRPDGTRDAFYRCEVAVRLASPECDAGPDDARRLKAVTPDEKEGVTQPMNRAIPHGTAAMRCYVYPIDRAAGVGLPSIPGGDWIAYRLSRNG